MKKFTALLAIVFSGFLLSWTFRYQLTVDEELIRITNEYQTYSLYNTMDHWTIAFCEPYVAPGIRGDTLHMSHADSKKSPHGDKIYKLYVKDEAAYSNRLDKQPEGQVLIKEVWNVRPVMSADSVTNGQLNALRSMKDGWYYLPTTRKALYIMYKTKPSKENDEGWWYGIVDIEQGAENAKVIESMKINRCIKCHQQNKVDRIFGDPY